MITYTYKNHDRFTDNTVFLLVVGVVLHGLAFFPLYMLITLASNTLLDSQSLIMDYHILGKRQLALMLLHIWLSFLPVCLISAGSWCLVSLTIRRSHSIRKFAIGGIALLIFATCIILIFTPFAFSNLLQTSLLVGFMTILLMPGIRK